MKTNAIPKFLLNHTRPLAVALGLLCSRPTAQLMAQAPCPEAGTFATGLLAPSKIIQTPRGNLIVAEGGPEVVNNGRVSIVDQQGNRRTLLDGLPSARTYVGDFNGTTGVYLAGRTLFILNGQGDVTVSGPVQGAEKANPTPASPLFSSVLAVDFPEALETNTIGFKLTLADHHTLKSNVPLAVSNAAGERTTLRLVVDFVDHLPSPRPDFADNVRHSHPYGIVADDTHLYVVDAGFNNVHKVEITTGNEQTLASFPPTPSPLTNGPPVLENVPTSIHWAGGQLLVTTFGGAPFLPGYSKVRRIDPQTGAAVSLIEGLTTAIDSTPLAASDLLAGILTLEYDLSFPLPGLGELRFYATPKSTPVTNSVCLNTPSSMLYDAKSDRLILSELSTGRLVSLPVPRSLAKGDSWIRKANLPTPRLGLSSCVLNGKIYAIGGVKQPEVDDDGLRSIQAYDPATDSWAVKANLPTARNWTACAAVNGKIYVIGGDTTFLSTPLKTVSEYDPKTDKWTQKANMPTARLAAAAAVVDGLIYVMGGLTTAGATLLSTVEAYDPVADTWVSRAPMPTPRGMLCASVVDGKIFAIGSNLGRTGPSLPIVEMYEPLTDTWTRKANMPTSRGGLAASTSHGRIYVVGGRDSSSSFATVEEYDPTTDTWTTRADMQATIPGSPSRSFGLGASEVNGRIYAIGGASDLTTRQGLSFVLEYTPPDIAPTLQMTPLTKAGQSVIRLEWPSRTDGRDLLQTQNQLRSNGWTDVERFSGSGETLTKEIPAIGPSSFYRLQRELR